MTQHWNQYLVAVGTNLGNRGENLRTAAHHLIQASCEILAYAPIYETVPIGAATEPFYNTAWLVKSLLGPQNFLRLLHNAEELMGRERTVRWGNRPIDLDILMWIAPRESLAPKIWQSEDLAIPHPRLLERDFMLVPAADVAPHWLHPDTGRSLREESTEAGYALTALGSSRPSAALFAPREATGVM